MKMFFPSATAVKVTLSIFIIAPMVATTAAAHHSTGLFDGTTIEVVKGTVTRVAWRSPHVYIFVEPSESEGESAEWRFEALPVPIMIREGWTEDSLSVGDLVTAEGYPATGAVRRYAWLHRIIKQDGTILDPGQTGSPGIEEESEVAN